MVYAGHGRFLYHQVFSQGRAQIPLYYDRLSLTLLEILLFLILRQKVNRTSYSEIISFLPKIYNKYSLI